MLGLGEDASLAELLSEGVLRAIVCGHSVKDGGSALGQHIRSKSGPIILQALDLHCYPYYFSVVLLIWTLWCSENILPIVSAYLYLKAE